jgi:phage-related protein
VTPVKRLPAAFFTTTSGAEPVRLWLQSLSKEDRSQIGDDIRLIEFGWPVGLPTCRPLGKGLKNRIARIFFTISGGEMVLLHGFIKKSQATPKSDLSLARLRQSSVEKTQ